MNNTVRVGGFNILPTVVKHLLIINGIFFPGQGVANAERD